MESRNRGKKLSQRIEADADGMRLEQYLRQRMNFTRAEIRAMKFRENGLLLNGERVRVSRILGTGDVLEVQLEDEAACSEQLEATAEPIKILYEDEDLLAVWKEAGLVVHPAHGHYKDTLSNRVHAYFQGKGEQVRIRSIGRLDKDTSGIVVFAKNQISAARLWKQKEEGVFRKEYLAVCEGEFSAMEGEVCAPIAPMPGEKMKMCVSPEGAFALTHYRVLRKENGRSLLAVQIETGRTHQIRVHMASVGHVVVGDVLYGTARVQGMRDVPYGTESAQDTGNVPYGMEPVQDTGNLPSGAGASEENRTSGEGLQLYAWKANLRQPFSGNRLVISYPEVCEFLQNGKAL